MNTFLVNDNHGLVNYWQKYEAGLAVDPENEGNAFLVSAITSQTETNTPWPWEDYRPSASTISGNRVEISNGMAVLLLLIVLLVVFAIVGCAYLCTYVLARMKRREPLVNEDTIPPSYDEIAKNDESQLPAYWQVAGRGEAKDGVDKSSQLPSYWVVAATKEGNNNPPPYCADNKDSGNPLPTYWVADGTKGDSDNSPPPYCIAAATIGVSENPLHSYWVADAVKEANENPLATCRVANAIREDKEIHLPSYWVAEGNELKGDDD